MDAAEEKYPKEHVILLSYRFFWLTKIGFTRRSQSGWRSLMLRAKTDSQFKLDCLIPSVMLAIIKKIFHKVVPACEILKRQGVTFMKTKKRNGDTRKLSREGRYNLDNESCLKIATTEWHKALKPLKISGSGSVLSLLVIPLELEASSLDFLSFPRIKL